MSTFDNLYNKILMEYLMLLNDITCGQVFTDRFHKKYGTAKADISRDSSLDLMFQGYDINILFDKKESNLKNCYPYNISEIGDIKIYHYNTNKNDINTTVDGIFISYKRLDPYLYRPEKSEIENTIADYIKLFTNLSRILINRISSLNSTILSWIVSTAIIRLLQYFRDIDDLNDDILFDSIIFHSISKYNLLTPLDFIKDALKYDADDDSKSNIDTYNLILKYPIMNLTIRASSEDTERFIDDMSKFINIHTVSKYTKYADMKTWYFTDVKTDDMILVTDEPINLFYSNPIISLHYDENDHIQLDDIEGYEFKDSNEEVYKNIIRSIYSNIDSSSFEEAFESNTKIVNSVDKEIAII